MTQSEAGHVPVLMEEVIASLAPARGESVIDATAGRGGHASELASRIEPGRIMLLDRDPDNLAYAAERVRQAAPATEVLAVQGDFRFAEETARKHGFLANMLLADLGVSSNQLDVGARGFGFQFDGPLDMRLDPSAPVTAADMIRDLSETELADVIFHLGEDPYARRIARKVAQSREQAPILTTAHLARLVREAYGSRARDSRLHPATRTFMALRIAVNDELGALEGLLRSVASAARTRGGGWLSKDARVAVISFHSLEDRLVKRTCATLADEGFVQRVNRKPIVAGDAEVASNARARSAKLRTIRLNPAA